MLSSNNTIDIFKRSLTVTVKSIGKSQDAEIKFVTENPSINGKQIESIIIAKNPVDAVEIAIKEARSRDEKCKEITRIR